MGCGVSTITVTADLTVEQNTLQTQQNVQQKLKPMEYKGIENYVSLYKEYNDEMITVIILPENRQIKIKNGTPAVDFLPQDQNVVAIYSNNEMLSLQEPIDICSVVKPIHKTQPESVNVLIETLCFLVNAAFTNGWPNAKLILKHSLQNGLYFEINHQFSHDQILDIEKLVTKYVDQNMPLHRVQVSHEDAQAEMKQLNQEIASNMILSLNNPTESMVEMKNENFSFRSLWHSPVLSHSGVAKDLYKLIPFKQGFIMYYATDFKSVSTEPACGSVQLQQQLSSIMDMYSSQATTIGFSSIAAINQLITQPKLLEDAITKAEFNHEKQIGEVAARASRSIKIIFVAGPSSSGKTTFANRLSCKLRSRGFEPIRVSLDDFYGLPAKAPRVSGTEKPDFEHLRALDLDRIKSCLQGLINDQEVVMAHYDFIHQVPGDGRKLRLPKAGILVVEGIHALNDEITQVVPSEKRLKVFIQPIGALPWDESHLIDHKLTRLMRRMCRDYLFRGHSADATLASWPAVMAGENTWILPNQVKADVYFNSSIMYEQFVLRVYAVPLLQLVPQTSANFSLARNLLRMLTPLQPIPVTMVPEMSLLCEFLPGGSQYEDFTF